MIHVRDRIDRVADYESNVIVTTRRGHVLVDRRESHNIFINQGRQWLRNLGAAAQYPSETGGVEGDVNLADDVDGSDPYSVVGKTFRVRYIGCGVGGYLQTIDPPGPGGQTEEVQVTQLETPVKTSGEYWLKQVLPQADLEDLEIYPDDYTIRYRAIFEYGELSFLNQVLDLGLNVPISEVGLYTSRAPTIVNPNNLGLIAYNVFSPISKTPKVVLEVAWDLRY